MPILGIIDSAKTGNLVTSSYESIQTITVGSATNSVVFSSIPTTYKHLQIRATMSCTAINNMYMRVGNGSIDTGGNYTWHQLFGDGTNSFSNGNGSASFAYIGYNYNTANPNPSIIDLLDYSSTVKAKPFKTLAGTESNGAGYVQSWGGSWVNTSSPIDTIAFITGGGNFNTDSVFALYGIRG